MTINANLGQLDGACQGRLAGLYNYLFSVNFPGSARDGGRKKGADYGLFPFAISLKHKKI